MWNVGIFFSTIKNHILHAICFPSISFDEFKIPTTDCTESITWHPSCGPGEMILLAEAGILPAGEHVILPAGEVILFAEADVLPTGEHYMASFLDPACRAG